MSELKEHLFCECDECIREYRGPLSNEMRPYYLKSEADNVILHHKYKRCLAMARWCLEKWYQEDTKCGLWHRWVLIWEELAEKFKEAK